jgi:hypothetical protein
MRNVALFTFLLAGCAPPDPIETCPPHVEALAACYERADLAVPEGNSEPELCAEEVLLKGAVYLCFTEAWDEGDCGTEKGIVALGVALERCIL